MHEQWESGRTILKEKRLGAYHLEDRSANDFPYNSLREI